MARPNPVSQLVGDLAESHASSVYVSLLVAAQANSTTMQHACLGFTIY